MLRVAFSARARPCVRIPYSRSQTFGDHNRRPTKQTTQGQGAAVRTSHTRDLGSYGPKKSADSEQKGEAPDGPQRRKRGPQHGCRRSRRARRAERHDGESVSNIKEGTAYASTGIVYNTANMSSGSCTRARASRMMVQSRLRTLVGDIFRSTASVIAISLAWCFGNPFRIPSRMFVCEKRRTRAHCPTLTTKSRSSQSTSPRLPTLSPETTSCIERHTPSSSRNPTIRCRQLLRTLAKTSTAFSSPQPT